MKNSQKTLNRNSHNNRSWASHDNLAKTKLFQSNQTHFLKVKSQNELSTKKGLSKDSKFHRHFASHTELFSSGFNERMYVPPHLNSSQVFSCIASECKQWQVRPSSLMKQTKKIDYDSVYNQVQQKYQKIRIGSSSNLKRISCASKIKDQIDQDRTRYQFRKPYKLYVEEKSGTEMEQDQENDSAPNFYRSNKNE